MTRVLWNSDSLLSGIYEALEKFWVQFTFYANVSPVVSNLPFSLVLIEMLNFSESAYRIWNNVTQDGGQKQEFSTCISWWDQTPLYIYAVLVVSVGGNANPPMNECDKFVFLSMPLAPPSCGHLSWEGGKCPKRPQRISWHDCWRRSNTQGVGFAYLCHQCWAWRSHKQRWKNKNR